MGMKAGSHNGDPSWFTQWKSKLVHTMEIQARSHNGDPSWSGLDLHCVNQLGSPLCEPAWISVV